MIESYLIGLLTGFVIGVAATLAQAMYRKIKESITDINVLGKEKQKYDSDNSIIPDREYNGSACCTLYIFRSETE